MAHETLLTRLEVSPKGELLAGLRNLGEVYFPGWHHLFPSKILGRNFPNSLDDGAGALMEKLKANPKTRDLETRIRAKYWMILQAFAPIALKDELPDQFIRGHYTQQARWRTANPGNYVQLDEQTVSGLKKGQEIKQGIGALRGKIESVRKPAYATRTFNDLDALFDSYDGTNMGDVMQKRNSVASLRDIDSAIIEERKRIADDMIALNSSVKGLRVKYSAPENKREHDFKVEKASWKFLEQARMPSAQELLALKWLFLDIEIPFFRRKDPKITWVGMNYCQGDRNIPQIHTIHDLGVSEVNGYKIFSYKNEYEMISRLTEAIIKENPDVLSSYNVLFDLIKLRESEAAFLVGYDESNPLLKVTTPFFERIGIKDRLVFDFLRWQKIARAYDINAKLEMAAGFNKPIDYNKMEALEDKCLLWGGQGQESGREIAAYLAEDVDRLVGLFKSGEFRKDLEDVCWICDNYKLGIERVMHSPNSGNDAQEKGFFANMGIYREEVPPHQRTKTMQDIRTKARGQVKKHFANMVMADEKFGLIENVAKVYVPTGDFMTPLVAKRYEDVEKIAKYKEQFKDDKKRLFFIEQYQKEFGRWLTEDYGIYLGDVKKFDELTSSFSQKHFEDVYHAFRNHLDTNHPKELKKLNRGYLAEADIEKCMIAALDEFMDEHGLDASMFKKIANRRSFVRRRVRNILGNYQVSAGRRFDDNAYLPAVDEVIGKRMGQVNEYLKKNNLQVVAKDGSYLYVAGNTGVLKERDCPVILVDEIPKLYNADNPYYQKFGFFSHMKLKDEPAYHLNVFEMDAYRKMLENLTAGNNVEAKQACLDALDSLNSGEVPMDELVFYNKSKEMFSAYLEGCDARDHFALKCPEDKELQRADGSLQYYFIDEVRGEEVPVYIGNPSELAPNIDIYRKRFTSRSSAILGPVGGIPRGFELEMY